MIQTLPQGAFLLDGQTLVPQEQASDILPAIQELRRHTMAYKIFESHNTGGDPDNLKIRFDAMASHDITFVGIIQTAIASGLKEFPLPYILTNCHNSLCAVGGTINEDDHVFGYSAAKKYGGQFVPPHQAVIHQYMREMQAGVGKMILGSDSHTRYGALGTMAIGEGGGELVKQLLCQTYDIKYPPVVAVYLKNETQAGVGPQDIALAIIGKVFASGYVKNKVLEFVGPGVHNLSMDFRNGIDVMTTETTCLSSIWCTDEKTRQFLALHGRPEAYRQLAPQYPAYYEGAVIVDLAQIKPMIAMPFHPSNIYTIDEVNDNLVDVLHEVEVNAAKVLANKSLQLNLQDKIIDGRFRADQGVIAGCAGGLYENIMQAAHTLENSSTGDFPLSVYPASQPIFIDLLKKGAVSELAEAGATIRTAFCGPCFGAGDVPENHGFSIRHTTRNFPNREGSKPNEGQIACVALMDARSIAATARNRGFLTAADSEWEQMPAYHFDPTVYAHRVYNGIGKPQLDEKLVEGPNIKPWPKLRRLPANLLLEMCAVITDPVTTTDELIPSGETSSYRSNPQRLAEFTLSRKVPEYVQRAKKVQKTEQERSANGSIETFLPAALRGQQLAANTGIGSVIFAVKPGDGSAREQAASCQRVLGGDGNIAVEYATKRYRSNLINWGIIPFTVAQDAVGLFSVGDKIFIEGIKNALSSGAEKITAQLFKADGSEKTVELLLQNLSKGEREILLAGCLINFNAE